MTLAFDASTMNPRNLVDVANGYVSDDIVNKFSSYLGESPEKTRNAFHEAIPSIFSGLVQRVSDSATSQSMADLLSSSGAPEERVLHDFSGAMATSAGTELLTLKGQGLLSVIFGGKLDEAIDGVVRGSGTSRGSAGKILALAAPLVTAVVGHEARGLTNPEVVALLTSQRLHVGQAFERAHRIVSQTVPVRPTRITHRVGAGVPILLLGAVALFALFIVLQGRHQAARMARFPVPAMAPTSEVTITGVDLPKAPSLVPLPEPSSVSAAAPAPQTLTLEEFDRTNKLAPEGRQALDAIAQDLTGHPQAKVKVEGFSDNAGSGAYALRSSIERADAIRQQLIDRGVDPARIVTSGRGAEQPAQSNSTSQGRAKNRRVEVTIY